VLLGDLGAAEDCAQEALLRTWQRWETVAAYERPDAWARRVVFNLALNDLRRRRRHPVGEERPGHERSSPGPDPDQVALARALRRLPRSQCEALVLHDGVGLSVGQVAVELDVPEGTVKSWLHRGRAAVALQLEEAPSGAGGEVRRAR
jgi:RNA polymerase sigma-70 factor (ECF subfamily)